jgi:hypothetical protein
MIRGGPQAKDSIDIEPRTHGGPGIGRPPVKLLQSRKMCIVNVGLEQRPRLGGVEDRNGRRQRITIARENSRRLTGLRALRGSVDCA